MREGFRASNPGLITGSLVDFTTVNLTPSENPDTTGKPVMENTHVVEQCLAVEIDLCELSLTIPKNYRLKYF